MPTSRLPRVATNYHSALFMLIAGILVLSTSDYIYHQEIQKMRTELAVIAEEKAQGLRSDLNELTKSTLFLSNLPSVNGIANVPFTENTNKLQTEAFFSYEEQLSRIFEIYLDSLPNLIQVRYIGIADNGREIVRVDKHQSQLIKIPEDKLQQKGSREYFADIRQLSEKEIFISDITLNQENGAFTIPYQPVIRLGTPIFTQHTDSEAATLFGEIVINVDADKIFKKLSGNHVRDKSEMNIYVLNNQEDFLVHPDSSRTFQFELGTPYRWADEFAEFEGYIINNESNRVWSVLDALVMSQESIYLDDKRKITVIVTLPAIQALERAFWFALFSFLVLYSAFFIYFFIKNRSVLKSQQLHLEHALKMEKEIHDIINNDPHGKLIIDRQGLITLANSHIEKVFGYKKSELIENNMSMLLPERYRSNHLQLMQAYLTSPEVKEIGTGRDVFGLHKLGHEVPLEIGLSPIIYQGKEQTLCAIVDISLRRKLEKQFELLVETSPSAIMLVNADDKIELVNKEAENMFGYTRIHMLDHPFSLLVPYRFQQPIQTWCQSLLDNYHLNALAESSVDKDIFALNLEKREFPISMNLRPIETPQGRRILVSISDLTERFEKDLALRKMSETLDRTSKIAGVGGWELDLITQNLLLSEETYRIYGLPFSTPITMEKFLSHYTDKAQTELKEAIEKAKTIGESWDLELSFITEKGKSIWVRTIGTTEFENDKAVRLVGTFQDVSERKYFIEELSRSNIELNNFAYVASHDLKSPLRGIDQLATWLEEDLANKLEVDDIEHLRLMRVRINRMEQLLDDLLAYSRSGKKGELTKKIDLNLLIKEVFDLFNVKQSFRLEYDNILPTFETESIPLTQVFRNLINNAIKHHDQGQGEIHISSTQENGFYVFRICDDGPGIPPEHDELVFTMFQTLRPRDEVEGSGMGLSIVKKIVTSFGGDIGLERQATQRGICVRFTWPIAMP